MADAGDMFGKKGDNFGEVKKLILSYFRTLILYLVLILVVRLMGKRQIGEMEPAEFVVTMLVANLAAIPMQDGGIPLFSGLIPILVVLGMELVLSWGTLRSQRFRKILCGKPVLLIENGKILQDKLRQTRITLDELMGHLRQKDVLNPQQVQYAILETNGTLSVFPYPEFAPAAAKEAGIQVKQLRLPVTIVEDGVLLNENLAFSGKDAAWVEKTLRDRNTKLEDTFLLAVAGQQILFIEKEEGK